VWSRILAAKKLLSNINSPFRCNCRFHQQFVVISDNYYGKYFAGYPFLYHHLKCCFNISLRSLLNVTSAVRQAVERTSWFKNVSVIVCCTGAKSALSLCPFCWKMPALLMGLSTFLVSWLGKEAMAGVGLADSFNMVIMSFFAAIDLGTTVVVAFSLGKRDRRRARAAARQSLAIMTLFSILLAG
jgi:hypothetical protein